MAALGPLLLGNASSQPLPLILTSQSRAQLSDEELSLSEFNQRAKRNFFLTLITIEPVWLNFIMAKFCLFYL